MIRVSCIKLIATLIILLPQAVVSANDKVAFFETKIRPILVKHCYPCHSSEADTVGGKLLLDTKAGILHGGESGPALVAGDTESSLLLQAIRYDGMEMPPEEPLPESVTNDFARWIREGAVDPRVEMKPPKVDQTESNNEASPSSVTQHWSFRPPTPKSSPKVQNQHWAKNSLDFFTLAAMERAGTQPTIDSSPRTLIRRVHYDLTGLPPTMEEIHAFESAYQVDREQAILDLVNRQLASPQFGIRWGRHWLDVARYGESNGDDGLGRNASFPHAWRYRNYVIDAVNRDIPYDRFLMEQIAGDLLPFSTAEERNRLLTATGFLAIGSKPASAMNNNFAMDIVDDQINVISTGVTGLSVACARCHDHKHDPITTRDYYALAGIFTSTETLYGAAGNEKLTAPPTPLHQLTSEIPQVEAHGIDRSEVPKLPEEYSKAVESLKPDRYASLVESPTEFTVDNVSDFNNDTFATVKDSSLRYQLAEKSNDYSLSFWFRNALKNDARPITTYLFSRATWGDKALPGDHLGIGGTHESSRTGKLFVFNGNDAKQSVAGSTVIPHNTWNHVTFVREKNQVRVYLNGQLEISGDLPAMHGDSTDISVAMRSDRFAPLQGNLGHLAIYSSAITKQQAISLHQASNQPPGPEPIDTLGFAMGVREKNSSSNCKIHINGESKKLGEEVPRGVPSVYGSAKSLSETIPEKGSGRLELAKWLTSSEHPQTARVMANRVWMHLFGKGIVATPNDFGVYGARPSHPKLLDHLATELVASEWSIKQLIRHIVLSRTYQLDSQYSQEINATDPSNQWYTRHDRRRLDAEAIRDSILFATGTLDPTTREGSDVDDVDMLINWPPGESTNLHRKTTRRSLFLCFLRHAPPTELAAFDLPDGVQVVGQRESSTLPTQSLFLMNNDFVIEQSQTLATQLESIQKASEKVNVIFNRALQRKPTDHEIEESLELVKVIDQQLINDVTDPARRASRVWASFAQAIMSTNEFRYVD